MRLPALALPARGRLLHPTHQIPVRREGEGPAAPVALRIECLARASLAVETADVALLLVQLQVAVPVHLEDGATQLARDLQMGVPHVSATQGQVIRHVDDRRNVALEGQGNPAMEGWIGRVAQTQPLADLVAFVGGEEGRHAPLPHVAHTEATGLLAVYLGVGVDLANALQVHHHEVASGEVERPMAEGLCEVGADLVGDPADVVVVLNVGALDVRLDCHPLLLTRPARQLVNVNVEKVDQSTDALRVQRRVEDLGESLANGLCLHVGQRKLLALLHTLKLDRNLGHLFQLESGSSAAVHLHLSHVEGVSEGALGERLVVDDDGGLLLVDDDGRVLPVCRVVDLCVAATCIE
mmetsp:Transcript_38898/g.111159  ORF Transcript_38898/g.111159 Transcript_38898/m.111159 type:complete len:352 (+) Transcript_38898:2714-3769(+)